MKRIYLYIVSAALLMSTNACNNFLDVTQKGTIDQDEMFNNAQGFNDAMYGIYATLASNAMYGERLTYGLADQFAQLYTDASATKVSHLAEITAYKYRDLSIKSSIDSLWINFYRVIGYVNNVIEHGEKATFRETGDMPIILGEAYGLRGFLHFEVIRWYSANYLLKPDAGGIPYAYSYDLTNKKLYTLKESYANILADLLHAESVLEKHDTWGKNSSTYQTDRFTQMNVYAVRAILARVYQAMGNSQKAAEYALKLVKDSPFALLPSASLKIAMRYPGSTETIWGVTNNRLYQTIYRRYVYTGTNSIMYRCRSNVNAIYENSKFTTNSTDIRLTSYFLSNVKFFARLLEKEATATEPATKLVQGIQVIRLPEMYYILAEALYDTDPTRAKTYLNDVRNARGLANLAENTVSTKALFMTELKKERCKELWGDGQIFLDYKRYNDSFLSTSNATIAASEDIFVLPWPDSELEYGQTN